MSATWFRCDPAKLIGALTAMGPEQGYVYTMVLMRIYEVGGPIGDDERSLARRTGYSVKKASEAIAWLIQKDKIQRLDNGLLDSRTTHEEIAYREKLIKDAQNAGNSSGKKRVGVSFKKDKQNQQTGSTSVERALNERNTSVERPLTELELEKEIENNNHPPLSTISEGGGNLKGFEEFWELFPNHEGVSRPKSEAAWKTLTLAERTQAVAGIPAVRASKTTNPHKPENYLRDKKFGSTINRNSQGLTPIKKVRVEKLSPQGEAWEAFLRLGGHKRPPWPSGVWWFDTEWPPTEEVA